MSRKRRVRIISPIPSIPESDDTYDDEHRDTEAERSTGTGNEAIPIHHQVLFNLLGADKAESFLNPKMEEPSSRRQSIHPDGKPSVLLPSIDTGMGAEAILKTLKEKSDKKILRSEREIPEEWKKTYNSYLRERLARDKPLHFRSFTEKPDVPDLDILKRKDYIYKVRRIRNHTNIMFRSSEQNRDRTTLLLNRNPLSECRQGEQRTSLERYFDKDTLLPVMPRLLAIDLPKLPSSPQSPKNLHFLSEDAAKCKGTFYEKYSHEDAMKMVTDVPGHGVELPEAMTRHISVSAPVNSPTSRRQWTQYQKKITPSRNANWHPLTIGSLTEYTPSKDTFGTGEFSYGTASRWRNSASTQC